jgi:hypothetical protein
MAATANGEKERFTAVRQGIKRTMSPEELASESVYFSLFRLVEIAELQDAEAAVQWAEMAISSKEMRDGLVERVKERGGAAGDQS